VNAGDHSSMDSGVCRSILGYAFWRRYFRCAVFGESDKVRIRPLPLLLGFGLGGVLIDLDHLISQALQRLRPLHLEYFICVWVLGICYYAYTYRRVHGVSVKEDMR